MTANKIKVFTIPKPIDTFSGCIKRIQTEY